MPVLTSVTLAWSDGTTVRVEPANTNAPAGEQVRLGSLYSAAALGELKPNIEPADRAQIVFENDPDLLFESLRLLQESNYQVMIVLPISLEDAVAQKEAAGNPAWPFTNPALGDYIQVLSPRLWKQESAPAPRTIIGAVFNARGYSGIVDLTVYDHNHRMTAEVLTAKLRYESEFKHLLSEVAEQQIQLLYEIGSITGERLVGTATTAPDLASTLFQLRRLMLSDELPAAIETILSAPLETLITAEERYDRARGRSPRAELLSRRASQLAFVEGGPLADLFQGRSPRQMPVTVKRQTFDNAENRYIKSFLMDLQELLILLEEACHADRKWIQAEEVHRWNESVSEWLDNRLWRDVGTLSAIPHNSQRLQKSAGYRDVFRADAELREALNIPIHDHRIDRLDSPLGDLKPVDALYEYWCYFTVRGILAELYGPDSTQGKGLLIRSAGRLSMRLAAKTDGYCAVYEQNLPPNVRLHLFFNRRFQPKPEQQWGAWSGSYSVAFDPDISIAIRTATVTHWISFDSKYRLERILWENAEQTPNSAEDEEVQAFKQEDLNKMHCYRDAILGTRGAFILFPGIDDTADDSYIRKAEEPRRGFGVPSVGAFPLRPRSAQQRQALKDFIGNIVGLLSSAEAYTEEAGLQ